MDKKHEDVASVAQIDKTSVFQEGMAATCPQKLCGHEYICLASEHWLTFWYSASLQSEPYIATEM